MSDLEKRNEKALVFLAWLLPGFFLFALCWAVITGQ